jgi:endoglucanase
MLGFMLGFMPGCAAAPEAAQSPAPAAPTVETEPAPVIDGDHSLLANGDFDDGTAAPWSAMVTAPARAKLEVDGGRLCMLVEDGGYHPWDVVLRHRSLLIEKSHQYLLRFEAKASQPTSIRPLVAMGGTPYVEYFASDVAVAKNAQHFQGHFRMPYDNDDTAELAFHLGGPKAAKGARVCFDEVRLEDPQFEPPRRFARGPRIAVNALGYLPDAPKFAVLAHPSGRPVAWRIIDKDGGELAKGNTTVFGEDAASGDFVHHIRFSSLRAAPEGTHIEAGGAKSDPFVIAKGIYAPLKRDALAFFYHNRSGIPIEASLAGEKWARPAGHLSDKKVPCVPGAKCDYALDVSGGWYDAGDHGKYVVNAGISVWTLLNLYEVVGSKEAGDAAGAGALRIPERENGVSDLLDEVRWELDWMMRMQVPKGKYAGMAHHKIHDDKWAEVPKGPHENHLPRHVHPPSTAATLNLAAVAAQAARIYRASDESFAKRCLQAAERAWRAAKKHPAMHASGEIVGGGAYGDVNVDDERYWAAAELYITTGKSEYKKALTSSPHYLKIPSPQEGYASAMTWAKVDALGTISLAVAPHKLGSESVRRARSAIQRAANAYAKMTTREGYRVPFVGGGSRRFPWGSNSAVANNMLLLGLAHQFSQNRGYLNAMLDGMSYLLGQNPLRTSYVTGYGAHAAVQPHHRFWAQAKNDKYPPPPPGALVGGPNTALDDPIAKKELRGCSPQKCWVDHIEAWSLNEVAINWNAPLAWVATYADQRAR